MGFSKRKDIMEDRETDGSNNDRSIDPSLQSEESGESCESSRDNASTGFQGSGAGSTGTSELDRVRRSTGNEPGLAERLGEILRGEGDGDLLLRQTGRDNRMLQWLQALDLQVIGACRADERLKPMLKLNVSSGVAEDRLLAHLSQHFEASEVGKLARCLCIPLVSIRVGRVIKQGSLLCPTSTRGHLNLTLLPSSELRISFIGDDGCTEKLALLKCRTGSSSVTIEEISADVSGRSFFIKLPGGQLSYFWISEKSKLLGTELLTKMNDLLERKPSLAELTGISESRLDCFATYLCSYLIGSTSLAEASTVITSETSLPAAGFESSELELNIQPMTTHFQKPSSRSRLTAAQQTKTQQPLYQGSLSPKTNAFKDGPSRNSSSVRAGVFAREKLKRLGEGHLVSTVDPFPSAPTLGSIHTDLTSASSVKSTTDELQKSSKVHQIPLLGLSDLLMDSDTPGPSIPLSRLSSLSIRLPSSQVPTSKSSHFSPYYCWCPPRTSSLQYTVTPPYLPSTSAATPPYLPPLSSFFSSGGSSSSPLPPVPPLNLADAPTLDYPGFLTEPLVRMPLPVSSIITMPGSQPYPTFTPFISDPIVHIPVLDVCSSGQGYLVSAGPAISTTISPLLPNFVNTFIPEAESMVEKGARETLRRLLIGSTQQTSTQLMEVLPAVLTSVDDSVPCVHGLKHSTMVAGSRGLYTGSRDVDASANSFSAVGLFGSLMSTARVVRSDAGPSRYDVDDDNGSKRFGDLADQSNEEGSNR